MRMRKNLNIILFHAIAFYYWRDEEKWWWSLFMLLPRVKTTLITEMRGKKSEKILNRKCKFWCSFFCSGNVFIVYKKKIGYDNVPFENWKWIFFACEEANTLTRLTIRYKGKIYMNISSFAQVIISLKEMNDSSSLFLLKSSWLAQKKTVENFCSVRELFNRRIMHTNTLERGTKM